MSDAGVEKDNWQVPVGVLEPADSQQGPSRRPESAPRARRRNKLSLAQCRGYNIPVIGHRDQVDG